MEEIFWLMCLTSCLAAVNASCLELPNVNNTSNNASSIGPYVDGFTVMYTCNDGFTPDGSRKYVCSGSKWTNGNLQCDQIFCRHVDIPKNGFRKNTPTYEVGSYMTFGCNEGYTKIGVGKLFCRLDGEWNPRQGPMCEIKNCGEFGIVEHGSQFQDNSETERNTYGSVVEVTCDRGYVLNGSPSITCDKDGNWGEKPVCEKSSCDYYPGLNSSCIGDTKLSLNGLFFMVCKSDVSATKTGPNYVRCSNNKWTPDPADEIMGCYCDCKVNVDEQTMKVQGLTDGYLKHLDTLQWSCKNNAVKANQGPLKCNDGKMETPRCIPLSPITNPVTSSPASPVTGFTMSTDSTDSTPGTPSDNILTIVLCLVFGVALLGLIVGFALFWVFKKRKNDPKLDLKDIPPVPADDSTHLLNAQLQDKTTSLNSDKSEVVPVLIDSDKTKEDTKPLDTEKDIYINESEPFKEKKTGEEAIPVNTDNYQRDATS